MDQKYLQSYRPHLLVYPEGHRMAGTTGVSKDQIKTGMIKVLSGLCSMGIEGNFLCSF